MGKVGDTLNVWVIKSRSHEVTVAATTAREAMDAARDWPHGDFGLIVCAQPLGAPDSEMIPIRTSRLLADWGDIEMARLYIEAAIAKGLGDTSAADLREAPHD
jgi:hypothetical protein